MTELLEENKAFIDAVAIESFKIRLMRKQPQDIGEAVAMARNSYKDALAMLDAREHLEDIYDKTGILIGDKRRRLRDKELNQ